MLAGHARLRQFLLATALLLAAAGAHALSFKITYAADAFFSRQSAVLDDVGQQKLRDLAAKANAANLEVIISVGHADAEEREPQALSTRRAEAAKLHLMQFGIAPFRIYTEGQGSKQPMAPSPDPRNRRTEIEFVGSGRDPSIAGFSGMAQWIRGPETFLRSRLTDPWSVMTPLQFLPHVDPEFRSAFLARMQLAAIHAKDDALLAQLLALPGVQAMDEVELPPGLYAVAYGDAFARDALGPAAARIAATDLRRVPLAEGVWCSAREGAALHGRVGELLPAPAVLARQPGDLQVRWLLCAAMRPEDLAWLRQAGVDFAARRAYDGATALHVAVANNELQSLVGLLRAGADPNARNAKGETPLHVVARSRWPLAMSETRAEEKRRLWDALVGAGADPQAVDASGATMPRP